jgi:hypothetical protein
MNTSSFWLPTCASGLLILCYSFPYGKPFFERRGWDAGRARRIPDRVRDGLRRWIPHLQSGERGRFLLELWGTNTFGITLIPLLFGVGILFWNGRSLVGWLLTAAGALFIFAGVLANMHIYFQQTSLFNTLVMMVLLVGGLGLIARAVRPHRETAE